MGWLVLPHALLPAVKGLRMKPGALQPRLSPGYALQEKKAEPIAERVLFLIDTFQRAALHPKVNAPPPNTREQERVCFIHNNMCV